MSAAGSGLTPGRPTGSDATRAARVQPADSNPDRTPQIRPADSNPDRASTPQIRPADSNPDHAPQIRPADSNPDRTPRIETVDSNPDRRTIRIEVETAGSDATLTMRLDSGALPHSHQDEANAVRDMPVSIYLSDGRVQKQVEAAVKQWLATADISVDAQASPLWDRGFGPSRLSRKPSAHQSVTKRS
jgi:hypothetical protein